MTEVLFLDGILNYTDPIFHFQYYFWVFLLIVVATVLSWVAWRYGPWKGYQALWGLYYAFKARSNAAFTTGLQLYFELISERDAKCVFDYRKWHYDLPKSKLPAVMQRWMFNYATAFIDDLPWGKALVYKFGKRNMDVEIAKRMQNYEWEESPSVTIGGIRTDIVLDADSWTLPESPQHKIIETTCLEWNEANPGNQIHSYAKFQRLMHDGVVKPPAGVKKEVIVPWVRIDSAHPIAMEAVEQAGAIRQIAREEEEANANPMSQHYGKLIIGIIGLPLMILVVRFVSFWMATRG